MSTRRLFTGFVCWLVLLSLGYFFLMPDLRLVFWSGIGFSSAAAVLVGVARNKPRRRTPWLLVSLALAVFTIGDAIYLVLTEVLHEQNPYPSVADLFYLAMYPLLVLGLLLLPRSATIRDRAGILDALVLTAGFGLLSYIFLISPYLRDDTLSTLQKLTSVAYPLSDVLFLAVAARLLTAVRTTPSVVMMAVGGVSLLVTDVAYGLIQLQGHWSLGGPVDVGWIVFYGTWGAAALHPSMTQLTEPRVVRDSEVTGTRMAVLTLSALIAPTVLFVEEVRGEVTDGVAIAALSATIFLLVLLRLAGLVQTNRRAVQRERGLREAGAALVSATDAAAVKAAVLTAVGRLFPPGTPHEVSLSLRSDPMAGASATSGGPRFVHVADLAPAQGEELSGFEIALVNPLVVADRLAGHPLVGTLAVAADDVSLGVLQGAVEVLASQAALAIERIALSTEVERRKSDEYFRTLVRNTADVILILDDDDLIRYASPSAAGMFGDTALPGRSIRDLVDPDQRELTRQLLELVRARPDRGSARADWTMLGGYRGQVQVEASCSDLRADPTVAGLVLTLRDVTEQRALERELKHRAFHDSLTGLANRVLFSDQVERAVNRARGNASLVGVLFVDLDDFKVINDTLGHDIGDHLLVAVGERLTGALRPNDSAARLGGDEFALLVEDATDPVEVEETAQRIVAALAEPVVLGGSVLSASASIGVATTADAGGSGDLLRQADLALYEAKGAGKGRWRRYQSALHTAVVERLALRSALDQALAAGEFEVHYQPIVRLLDGVTVGFEGLVRWLHPTRGLVGPSEFVDVAEDTGQIVAIGNWVLHRAINDAARWPRAHAYDETYVSVNVSARQFHTPGFIDRVRDELARAGLPPHRLMLEITESLLLRDDEQVWSDLTALRESGIRVAIDDFGTGYSSLSYLRQVAIDVVKIDKSFIDTMATSRQQRDLVEGIVGLAHTLGLQVIAEGVERPRDRDLLVTIGCSFGQGYLFSRPMAYEQTLRWLQSDHVPVT